MATKTINISLPQEVIKQIDRKAKQEYKTRSELFRVAALEYVQKDNFWEAFRADAARRARKLGIKTEDDVEELIDSSRK